MAKELDLESFTLVFPTISKFSKYFHKPFNEMQALLFEQDVTPGQINPKKYLELKSKMSMDEIAEYYGVAISTLYKTCSSQKLNKPLSNISKKDLLLLINKGKSIKELADYFKVSYAKMNSFLKEKNLQTKKKKKARISKALVKDLNKKGFTIKEIAKKLKCTEPCIRYHLQKD